MVKVKICGITNLEDALEAAEYGADLLGFIFVEGTPRFLTRERAKAITAGLDAAGVRAGRTALFKDEDIDKAAEMIAACGMDHVQLHGEETPDYCVKLKEALGEKYGLEVKIIKTFKVADGIMPHSASGPDDYKEADYFLFDTYHPELAGGSGLSFDRDILAREKENIGKPFFIAGGLTPENVSGAVRAVRPYGVDTSSGVERKPGKKDGDLLKEFIKNAKRT